MIPNDACGSECGMPGMNLVFSVKLAGGWRGGDVLEREVARSWPVQTTERSGTFSTRIKENSASRIAREAAKFPTRPGS